MDTAPLFLIQLVTVLDFVIQTADPLVAGRPRSKVWSCFSHKISSFMSVNNKEQWEPSTYSDGRGVTWSILLSMNMLLNVFIIK